MVVWLLVVGGMSVNMAVGIGLVALLALDWYFDFSAVMALMAPVILIGGMTLGWFTPTEAAVAAVIWSLFLGLVRYRSMTLQTVAKATFDTIETTASVLFIVTAASIFRLAADGVAGGADADGRDARDHPEQVGVPAARQHPDPVRRLLHRHHRRRSPFWCRSCCRSF
jgi:TRAP-type mannitol/chloroaromatic compound transport system permease large subunit